MRVFLFTAPGARGVIYDALTGLAIADGLMPISRSTARFNWHHGLILRALRQSRVLQIVLRRLLGGALA